MQMVNAITFTLGVTMPDKFTITTEDGNVTLTRTRDGNYTVSNGVVVEVVSEYTAFHAWKHYTTAM